MDKYIASLEDTGDKGTQFRQQLSFMMTYNQAETFMSSTDLALMKSYANGLKKFTFRKYIAINGTVPKGRCLHTLPLATTVEANHKILLISQGSLLGGR